MHSSLRRNDPGVDDRNRGWASRTTHTSWAGGLTGGRTYFATHYFRDEPEPLQHRIALSVNTADQVQSRFAADAPQR
jgi:hypothetical protein